jgi:tripartite-type tricarboxylate transporter receptor subunit TctC
MIKLIGALFSAFVFSTAAVAQQAAIPPLIKIIVPFAPGASTDVIARALAVRLGPRLGTTVIVENRAGANGLIGATSVVKGPTDGSSLMVISSSLLTVAATKRDMPFDVTKDLIPVAVLGEGPLVIGVSASSNIKTPADLVAAARAKPKMLTHGTGGTGTIAHMAQELLDDAAKMQIQHVPYRGAALAMTDLMGGTIDMVIAAYSTLASGISSGRVRPIAVTTLQPSTAFPSLPTMASAVPGYSADIWVGLWAPAGMSPALVERLNREVNELTKSKEYADVLKADGNQPVALAPAELSTRVRNTYTTWKKLAVEKNILVD